jgi:hypothetical protein
MRVRYSVKAVEAEARALSNIHAYSLAGHGQWSAAVALQVEPWRTSVVAAASIGLLATARGEGSGVEQAAGGRDGAKARAWSRRLETGRGGGAPHLEDAVAAHLTRKTRWRHTSPGRRGGGHVHLTFSRFFGKQAAQRDWGRRQRLIEERRHAVCVADRVGGGSCGADARRRGRSRTVALSYGGGDPERQWRPRTTAAIPDGDGGSVRGLAAAVPVGGNLGWADGPTRHRNTTVWRRRHRRG